MTCRCCLIRSALMKTFVCMIAEPGSGTVDVHAKEGETTKSGAQAETFGTGRAAQSEAGKKGGAISGAHSAPVLYPVVVC